MSADDRMAGGSVAFASRKRSRETPEENQWFFGSFSFPPLTTDGAPVQHKTPLIGFRLKDVVSRRPIERCGPISRKSEWLAFSILHGFVSPRLLVLVID